MTDEPTCTRCGETKDQLNWVNFVDGRGNKYREGWICGSCEQELNKVSFTATNND